MEGTHHSVGFSISQEDTRPISYERSVNDRLWGPCAEENARGDVHICSLESCCVNVTETAKGVHYGIATISSFRQYPRGS
jgi:hypothetical protein